MNVGGVLRHLQEPQSLPAALDALALLVINGGRKYFPVREVTSERFMLLKLELPFLFWSGEGGNTFLFDILQVTVLDFSAKDNCRKRFGPIANKLDAKNVPVVS